CECDGSAEAAECDESGDGLSSGHRCRLSLGTGLKESLGMENRFAKTTWQHHRPVFPTMSSVTFWPVRALDEPGGPPLESSSQAAKPFWHILADVAGFWPPFVPFPAHACSFGPRLFFRLTAHPIRRVPPLVRTLPTSRQRPRLVTPFKGERMKPVPDISRRSVLRALTASAALPFP